MNFNSVFEELNSLYEKAEKPEQVKDKVKEEPVEEGCAKKADNQLNEYYDDEAPRGRDTSYNSNSASNWGDPVPQWWLDQGGTAKSWAGRNKSSGRYDDEVGAGWTRDRRYNESKEALKEDAAEEEIEFAEEPVEPIEDNEEPVEEVESRQLILECSKCGAIVIKDEADVAIDEESDLVNVEDTCEYCEEAEGYKIIGVVAAYEAAEEVEEVEEAVVESVDKDKIEELFNLNVGADLRNFGGTGNNVSVLGGGLTNEELEKEAKAEEDEDLDELFNTNIKLDARGFGGSGNDVGIL